MGYRSKVIIGVKSGKLSEEFDNILRKHEFPVDTDGCYLRTIDDPNEMKRYQFEQIKWYETKDWCKEIMAWIHETSEDNDSAFCVGMAYDDGQIHSEVGMFWEYVDVIQDINLID